MAVEYQLPFTAAEIHEKLVSLNDVDKKFKGKADLVNGKVPLEQLPSNIGGTGGFVSSEAIIDVTILPTENINKKAFYRLPSANFVWEGEILERFFCHYVDVLPETGESVTNFDMTAMIGYYNAQDGGVYGYVDEILGAYFSVPAGWYDFEMLMNLAPDASFGGVITDISDDPRDGITRVLIKQSFYIYQDGWTELAFGYKKTPKFDISWDGVIGDKFALDLSALGYEGTLFIKVSDEVFTAEQIIGAKLTQLSGYYTEIDNDDIDSEVYPGALTISGGSAIVCYSSDETNAALGLPSGYLTNGIYFVHVTSDEGVNYTNRFTAPSKIVKIDDKYLSVDLSALETSYENAFVRVYDEINGIKNTTLKDYPNKSEMAEQYYTKFEINELFRDISILLEDINEIIGE